MVEWEIPSILARSSRPGYGENNPGGFVGDWIAEVKKVGVKSILCLLADHHLSMYADLPDKGLLETYRLNGFNVGHVPIKDHKRPAVNQAELEQIWAVFQGLEKPVLVHCSAGLDRTGAAVEHIRWKLDAND